MKCPACGEGTAVVQTIQGSVYGIPVVKRYRKCRACGERVTTIEQHGYCPPALPALPFDRQAVGLGTKPEQAVN